MIADSSFSLNKDNPSWPDANHEEAITLGNTDSGLALINGTETVDAVGWGNPVNINEGLFEGNPHTGVTEGQSILRTQDTNNNLLDFISTTPVFYTPDSDPLEIIIDVEVNITDNNPEIIAIELLSDDNSSKQGIQINPISENTKTFEVIIEAYDKDNSSDIESAKVSVNNKEFELTKIDFNETHVFFKGEISMEYYDEAKNYTLQAIITSNEKEFSKESEFEYTKLASITAETTLGFELAAGNESVKTVTVKNTGNQEVTLKVKGTNIVSDESSISVNSIQYSIDNFSTISTLTNEYVNLTTLTTGESLDIKFKVIAEQEVSSGSYKGQIKISGK